MKKLVSITAIALVLALALGGAAFAADKIWAKGTPTVIVGFGAGGGTDTSVRPMIVLMSKYLGETINVANMPGAASAVAAEHVLGLPADGYTMFLVNPANGINHTLYKNLPFSILSDLAPVAGLIRSPNVMEVTNNFPAKTVAELLRRSES